MEYARAYDMQEAALAKAGDSAQATEGAEGAEGEEGEEGGGVWVGRGGVGGWADSLSVSCPSG